MSPASLPTAARVPRRTDAFSTVRCAWDATALVVKVDPSEQKISLSIRAVTDKAERKALQEIASQQAQTQTTTLGDLLAEKLAQKAETDE